MQIFDGHKAKIDANNLILSALSQWVVKTQKIVNNYYNVKTL